MIDEIIWRANNLKLHVRQVFPHTLPYFVMNVPVYWLMAVIVVAGVIVWVTRPRKISRGERVIAEFDAAMLEEDVPFTHRGYARIASQLSIEASLAFKEKFGECNDTKANRLMAQEFVRDWFREEKKDLRIVDRLQHTPMAVELCFVPSVASVVAHAVSRDAAVVARKRQVPLYR